MAQGKEGLGDPSGSGMRPTRGELYDALTELQSSAAAYVQGLEAENRALREALRAFVEMQPGGNYRDDVTHTIWISAGKFRQARAALKDKP